MCGRFTLGKEPNSLLDYFHLHGEVPNFHLSYNIAPTQMTPIVLGDQQNRVCELMRWGLIPSWSKGPDAKFNMINARAESLEQKPAYRTAFRLRRCLVPADGFYEWSGQAKPKQPYYIYQEGRSLFAFAGLWEQWSLENQSINSFSIITAAANEVMQNIHQRMPVIIKPECFDNWLFGDANDSYKSLVAPDYISGEDIALEYYPVATKVNSVKHNSPELLKPL